VGKAVKKYGEENFTVEEIGGANSMSELNYQEWLLIHKYNSLAPNGYNLREGGGGRITNKESRAKMSKSQKEYFKNNDHRGIKSVINIKTGHVYKSAKEAAIKTKHCYSTLKSKLQGQNGNDTDLRYLNDNKYKAPVGSGNNQGNEVYHIETGEIYRNTKVAAKANGLIPSTVNHCFNYKSNTYKCLALVKSDDKKYIEIKDRKTIKI